MKWKLGYSIYILEFKKSFHFFMLKKTAVQFYEVLILNKYIKKTKIMMICLHFSISEQEYKHNETI